MAVFESRPLEIHDYQVRQPRYKNLMRLPARICCLSPSGGGKTTAVVNLLQDGFKSCFSAIYVFSHSAFVDPSWRGVEAMIKKMGAGGLYDDFDDAVVRQIYDEHEAIVTYQKSLDKPPKYIHSICIVLDDVVDNPRFRHSNALETLAIRGRHSGVTLICTAQKLKLIPPVMRTNFSDVLTWAINSRTELQQIIEENSAIIDMEDLYRIYYKAIRDRFSFMWINKRDRTFHVRFGPAEN